MPKSSGPVNTLLYGSTIVSLALWTTFGDPFNSLKLSFILATAFWLVGYLITDYRSLTKKTDLKIIFALISTFVLSLLLATLNSKHKQVAWIGDYQRNNGFLFYSGLCIIMLTTSYYFQWSDLRKLSNLVLLGGVTFSFYSLLQLNGIDFAKYLNQYNPIILTFGNPNFAAAFMAIMAVLIFGFGVLCFDNKKRFIIYMLVFSFLLVAIILSEARQGLLGLLLGCMFIISILIYSASKFIGRLVISALGVMGIITILGILQIGPLSQLLYKGSVTARGYYWRAGIEMLRDNPWFGVGVDDYGDHFRQYKDLGYVLNYGFDISSSNAHNIFIQLYSTAGIFAGTTYALLTLYILWRGFRGLWRRPLKRRIALATIMAAWLSWQATSFVSIDSPGVAIWGWVLGGIIVALTADGDGVDALEPKSSYIRSKSVAHPIQTVLSALLMIPILALSVNIFQVENAIYSARKNFNPQSEASKTYLNALIPGIVKNPVINSEPIVELVSYLVSSGFEVEGMQILNNEIAKNPRNMEAINLLALYYTELGQPEQAVKLRLRIAKLDPYNAKNYYKLGLNYKSLGDITNMEKMKSLVLSFARNSPEGDAVSKELVP